VPGTSLARAWHEPGTSLARAWHEPGTCLARVWHPPSVTVTSEMGQIRVGPARCPSRESPELAVELLLERGYSACELDLESGFWLDYPWAERLGELAREHDIALSVHAPLFAFPGHPDAKKSKMALGALDRTAGIAAAAGAEVVVIHPGFWLGRDRQQTLDDVAASLGTLREKLESKNRAVPFGVEVMGRVNELGSIDDVLHLAARIGWVRPVIDFAHMHATSDGAFTDVDGFAAVLEGADAVLEPGAPFHVHFSDIAYANRNETKHLPYGEGTLRADPLRQALERFERPATVISESPDETSSQAIKAALYAGASAAS
jgi:deoxyribonuclease IV